MSIRQELEQLITHGLAPWCERQGLRGMPPVTVEEPPSGVQADFACTAAFHVAKALRRRPAEVAQVIGEALTAASRVVRHVDVLPAGFVNISLNRTRLADELCLLLTERQRYGAAQDGARPPVLIEFVSANPTGPLHVGHGRGAAIGDSLARLYAFQGFPVTREYYVNDMGTQMELLAQSVEARYAEFQGKPSHFPEQGYRGEYVIQIARQLAEELAGHHGKTSTPPAPPSPSPSPDTAWFGQRAQEILLAEITEDLRTFRITFDRWFKESTLHREQVIPRVIAELRSRGVAYDEGGAVWVATDRYGDEKPRVVVREDGRPTYFAADIAYHLQKLQPPQIRLIDVWGADHHGYAPRLRAALQALKIDPVQLTIVLYQLVALVREGRPVPMSTRAGEFVTLREVIQEVGVDACRFFFLMRSPEAQLQFDLELAKRQSPDNPVYYVQYAHARSNSILREAAKQRGKEHLISPSRGEGELHSLPGGVGLIVPESASLLAALHEAEAWALIKRLALFPDVVTRCLRDASPHHLTTYLMELAGQFHKYYDHYRVITDDPPLTAARLAVVDAVRQVLSNGLSLLGVTAPDKM